MPIIGWQSAPSAANNFRSPPPMPPFQYMSPGAKLHRAAPAMAVPHSTRPSVKPPVPQVAENAGAQRRQGDPVWDVARAVVGKSRNGGDQGRRHQERKHRG